MSFWPHRGSDGQRLLIVGQAVYGWADDWRAADATSATGRERVVEMIKVRNRDVAEPMAWIEHSDRRDKPFWKSCHLLAERLDPGSPPPSCSRSSACPSAPSWQA